MKKSRIRTEGREEDDDAVILGVRRVVAREGRVSEEAGARARHEADGVHVERVDIALAELLLHRRLRVGVGADAVEPVVVRSTVRAS